MTVMSAPERWRVEWIAYRGALRTYVAYTDKRGDAEFLKLALENMYWIVTKVEKVGPQSDRCRVCGHCKHDHTGYLHEWIPREESPATPTPGGQG